MHVDGLGHVLFAGGLAGLGVLSLLSGDFALNWQPVPPWIPWRQHLAHASGLILFASGSGAFLRRWAPPSALILTVNVVTWLLLLQLPRVVMNPTSESMWLGFSETLVLVAGGWIVFASLAASERCPYWKVVASDRSVRIARFFFATALPLIGLSHFVYVQATAALVPEWLPDRMGLAYLTGGAHIAAGVALLLAILPRLAATLEAFMISSFTLLVWVPRVAAAPWSRVPWTALLASSALTGASWAVAHSIRDGLFSRSTPQAPVQPPLRATGGAER
jgi:uncharacterized membrane protein